MPCCAGVGQEEPGSAPNDEETPSESSKQLEKVDHDTLPLPRKFAYLQEEVNMCRLYVQKKHYECVHGPGDTLNLPGPMPPGKTHTLVLDLDETIVLTCISNDERPCDTPGRPSWAPDKAKTFWSRSLEVDVLLEVWYRPGLMKFLAAVSEHYEIVIFSAGSSLYVQRAIDMVDPERKYISQIFSKDDLSHYKPLERIPGMQKEQATGQVNQVLTPVKNVNGFFGGPYPRNPARTVCVDDKIGLFVYNLHNAVPIKVFVGEANDDALTELGKFLVSSVERDLRQEIKSHCNLPGYVGPKIYLEFLALNRPAWMPALA